MILAASKKAEYAKLIDVAIDYGKQHVSKAGPKSLLLCQMPLSKIDDQGGSLDEKVDASLDRLLVEFGKEILKIIPGKVSTEVDARFSFDTKTSVEKALHIIEVRLFVACGS